MSFTERVQALLDKDVVEGRMYPVTEEEMVPGVYLMLPISEDAKQWHAVSTGFFMFAVRRHLCEHKIVGRQMYLGAVPTKYIEHEG